MLNAAVCVPPVIDFSSLREAELHREPFDYICAGNIIRREAKRALLLDFPEIEKPGSYPLDILRYGPAFQRLVDEVLSPEFEKIVGEKFELDLSEYSRMVTVRGYCHLKSDGKIHTDSKDKVISGLLYLNENWSAPGGRLRLLRSPFMEDYATEIRPEFGNLLLFRRCDYSYHGHLPYQGRRLSLQFNWVKRDSYRHLESLRHHWSAWVKSVTR